MTSDTGKKIVLIHILLNISRIKDNQKMEFAQLIENNMINIFFENYAKM